VAAVNRTIEYSSSYDIAVTLASQDNCSTTIHLPHYLLRSLKHAVGAIVPSYGSIGVPVPQM
jgi:hypothetical protein